MAIAVTEEFDSRPQSYGLNPSAELRYIVTGTNDEAAAIAAVNSTITPYGLLWPNQIDLEQMDAYSGGFKMFRASVKYGPVQGGLGVGEGDELPTFTCDYSGESAKILQGLAVVNTYSAPGEPSVNFRGAINVTSDGVEGVEIEVPVFTFSLTISIPTSLFTTSYQASVARITKSINNSTWRGFAPKEVRFDGMSVSGTFGERTSMTYRFSVSPNADGLQIGDITGITKAGWDYLWCYYWEVEDDDSKFLIKKPLQVNVNQVYPLANFLLLGLGG